MADADLEQLELQAGKRPFGHFLGQFYAAQNRYEAVGKRVRSQPDRVIEELPVRHQS